MSGRINSINQEAYGILILVKTTYEASDDEANYTIKMYL